MNKKGDKTKVSCHNSVLQLLSWLCESEVTLLYYEIFWSKTTLISKYNSKAKENKSHCSDNKKSCIFWSSNSCEDLGVWATASEMEQNFSQNIAIELKKIFFCSVCVAHPFALQVYFGLMMWAVGGEWSAGGYCSLPSWVWSACAYSVPLAIDSVPRGPASASKTPLLQCSGRIHIKCTKSFLKS